MEDFELISSDATEITLKDRKVPIERDIEKYISLGIHPRPYDNPRKLVDYAGIIRYYSDTNPLLVSASEDEIRSCIPHDIPHLLTLDKFHFSSFYEQDKLPGSQETYKLIAKVLVTQDASQWLPTLAPNNHWSNWESGSL